MKTNLSLLSQRIKTKLCKPRTAFTRHLHSSCGMVWYRTLRVKVLVLYLLYRVRTERWSCGIIETFHHLSKLRLWEDPLGKWQEFKRCVMCFSVINNNNNHIQSRFSRFFTISSQCRELSLNTYAQVAQAQSCANHVQHIERLSRASVMLRSTWYEGTAQLLSLTELKSHLFEFCFVGWVIKLMIINIHLSVNACASVLFWLHIFCFEGFVWSK